jgi:hypothetical protein
LRGGRTPSCLQPLKVPPTPASFSISKTDAGASLVLKMGQTQILRFELRDAKNSLENDVEIKSLMDFNSFATKLRDTNGFKLNSKEDQQEFFNFLSHGRYPEGKIQSLKNYLAKRSETTIKVESKVNNKIVFKKRTISSPLFNKFFIEHFSLY